MSAALEALKARADELRAMSLAEARAEVTDADLLDLMQEAWAIDGPGYQLTKLERLAGLLGIATWYPEGPKAGTGLTLN